MGRVFVIFCDFFVFFSRFPEGGFNYARRSPAGGPAGQVRPARRAKKQASKQASERALPRGALLACLTTRGLRASAADRRGTDERRSKKNGTHPSPTPSLSLSLVPSTDWNAKWEMHACMCERFGKAVWREVGGNINMGERTHAEIGGDERRTCTCVRTNWYASAMLVAAAGSGATERAVGVFATFTTLSSSYFQSSSSIDLCSK